jgi:hypothetical protein
MNPSASKVVAALSTSSLNFAFVIVSTSDGSMARAYAPNSASEFCQFTPDTLVFDSSDNIYVACSKNSNAWQIFKFSASQTAS